MKFIQGKDRRQSYIFPTSLEEAISLNNEIRFIDLFVNSLQLESFGFNINFPENGRPAYQPKYLLKLYIYGYMNKIRSSRDLEKETKRSIEVMWLLNSLSPDHNTISNFRRDNPKAIKKVFRQTVQIAKNFELIGGKLLAGDSTKFRAQNSKKNNFNEKKIDRHTAYIDNKLEQYESQISEADGDDKKEIEKKITKQKERKSQYEKLQKQIDDTCENQVSTSDPESRQMIVRNNITEVAYNVQTTVDEKHKIPIDYKVTNTNDSKAMGVMLQRAKSIVRNNKFTSLYDKGYHTGSEFSKANKLGIDVLVAIPRVAANAPNTNYNVEYFKYDKESDYYVCPQGNRLTTTGKLHKAKTYTFKRYTTKACLTCPVKDQCSKAKYGKAIQRSEYQELIDKNKERINNNKEYYRKRQAIVEHPYGTIKRQWGFNYILTKKYTKRAEADVGLMFTAYNLRRLITILGLKNLQEYLRAFVSMLYALLKQLIEKISHFKRSIKMNLKKQIIFEQSRNVLIFDKNLIDGLGY